MRKTNIFLAAFLMVVLASGLTFAQRGGPHRGGPGHHGFPGDTVRPPHGPGDSTIGRPPHGGAPDLGSRLAVKDSCFRIFLGTIPADSAAMIKSDMDLLAAAHAEADTLRRQMFAAYRAKDSAAIAGLRAQLEALHQRVANAAKDLKSILDQYKDELIALRKDCGGFDRPPHRGGPGTGGGVLPLFMTPIAPNPAPNGVSPSFNYTLGAPADVTITISDMMGNTVKTVFTGNVTDLTPQRVMLDLSGLQRGIYIVRVQAGNTVESQKLMVQ